MAERYAGQSEQPAGGNIVDVPLTGGARNDISARHIAPNEAVELYNADVETPAFIKKRSGYVSEAIGSEGMVDPTIRPAFLADFDVDVGSRLFVVGQPGVNGGVYVTAHPESDTPWTRLTVTAAPTGSATGQSLDVGKAVCPVAQGNGLLWIMGSGNVHAVTVSGGLIDCGDEPNSPPRGIADAAYFQERLWWVKDNQIGWSKLLPSEGDLTPTPDAFRRTLVGSGTAGGVLTLSPKSRASATALVPWRDQSLIVFFQDRIEEVVVNSSSPANSARNVLESRIGCASRRSILAFGDEVVFLDNFGNWRSLRETITGQTRGIALADPINEKIKREFPARLNREATDRCITALLGDRIVFFYPRDSDSDPGHAVWYSPGSDAFEIMPAAYADTFSDVICSNILGREELWATSASGGFRLFRFDESVTSDNGAEIEVKVTLRAFDNGDPWSEKTPLRGRMEWRCRSAGQVLEAWYRTNLADPWTLIKNSKMPQNGDFPVPRASFPVLRASFPLTKGRTDRIEKFPIEGTLGYGTFPLGNNALPIYNRDAPLDGDRGVNDGPVVQMMMREVSTKWIEIDSYETHINTNKPDYQNAVET